MTLKTVLIVSLIDAPFRKQLTRKLILLHSKTFVTRPPTMAYVVPGARVLMGLPVDPTAVSNSLVFFARLDLILWSYEGLPCSWVTILGLLDRFSADLGLMQVEGCPDRDIMTTVAYISV